MTNEVYITKAAKFLPNQPILNDEMEDYLGKKRAGDLYNVRSARGNCSVCNKVLSGKQCWKTKCFTCCINENLPSKKKIVKINKKTNKEATTKIEPKVSTSRGKVKINNNDGYLDLKRGGLDRKTLGICMVCNEILYDYNKCKTQKKCLKCCLHDPNGNYCKIIH